MSDINPNPQRKILRRLSPFHRPASLQPARHSAFPVKFLFVFLGSDFRFMDINCWYNFLSSPIRPLQEKGDHIGEISVWILEVGIMSNQHYEFRKSITSNRHFECSNSTKLRELRLKSDNHVCADCGALDPKWALSVTLDEWSDEDIESMVEVGGNSSANLVYEAYVPMGLRKPKPNASIEERTKFIRSKYEFQEFLKPSLRMISSKSSFKSHASGTDIDAIYSPKKSLDLDDATETIGSLKVKVVRGIDLAIRDFSSSDPYVVLSMGQQKSKTAVIHGNLNPIWNEVLQLAVPQRYCALKLQVFDHDVFSADDIMGEAEVDLQPFLAATTAFGDEELPYDLQVGRWLKSSDNALVKDSVINIIGGKIRQEVHIKLQNVERGEIELELEWIPAYK
ncbi:hypothetical protein HPP92_022814 [Vanilla planifolia]|uniref:C2 domain-containing protein n=1 Tax=Vanilla planifolia TaxID=51239 RepID=A0A835UDJ1_VANPL|nr:hypothetical protein HPP92_022814 [Vanilla planifolia]